MYKTETHLHVSEVSPCGKLTACEMVELYHEAGYKTVCISDHLKQKYCDSFGDIPWRDKVTIFMSGYYRAKAAAEKYGMNVIPSVEVMFESEFPNHYLLYGIEDDFLYNCPELCMMKLPDFYKIAKENGVFVVQAHPFRDESCYPTPEWVDAFEIYNSNPRHEDLSEKSEACAKENNLYMLGGSDAHRTEDVGRSGIETEFEIKTAQDFIRAVKSGEYRIIRGEGH